MCLPPQRNAPSSAAPRYRVLGARSGIMESGEVQESDRRHVYLPRQIAEKLAAVHQTKVDEILRLRLNLEKISIEQQQSQRDRATSQHLRDRVRESCWLEQEASKGVVKTSFEISEYNQAISLMRYDCKALQAQLHALEVRERELEAMGVVQRRRLAEEQRQAERKLLEEEDQIVEELKLAAKRLATEEEQLAAEIAHTAKNDTEKWWQLKGARRKPKEDAALASKLRNVRATKDALQKIVAAEQGLRLEEAHETEALQPEVKLQLPDKAATARKLKTLKLAKEMLRALAAEEYFKKAFDHDAGKVVPEGEQSPVQALASRLEKNAIAEQDLQLDEEVAEAAGTPSHFSDSHSDTSADATPKVHSGRKLWQWRNMGKDKAGKSAEAERQLKISREANLAGKVNKAKINEDVHTFTAAEQELPVEESEFNQKKFLSALRFKQKTLRLRAEKVVNGTVLTCNDEYETANIYSSPDCRDIIGVVSVGEQVEASGDTEQVHGCILVCIKPQGVVKLELFDIADTPTGSQAVRRQHPPEVHPLLRLANMLGAEGEDDAQELWPGEKAASPAAKPAAAGAPVAAGRRLSAPGSVWDSVLDLPATGDDLRRAGLRLALDKGAGVFIADQEQLYKLLSLKLRDVQDAYAATLGTVRARADEESRLRHVLELKIKEVEEQLELEKSKVREAPANPEDDPWASSHGETDSNPDDAAGIPAFVEPDDPVAAPTEPPGEDDLESVTSAAGLAARRSQLAAGSKDAAAAAPDEAGAAAAEDSNAGLDADSDSDDSKNL